MAAHFCLSFILEGVSFNLAMMSFILEGLSFNLAMMSLILEGVSFILAILVFIHARVILTTLPPAGRIHPLRH